VVVVVEEEEKHFNSEKLFANSHTTQSYVVSVTTVSIMFSTSPNNVKLNTLNTCRVIFLKLKQTCVSLLDLYTFSFNYN